MNQSGKRIISYDVLRILSAYGVILMHLTTGNLFSIPVGTKGWLPVMIVNGAAHFGVPIFVMISGALFLDPSRDIDIKKLWTHSIIRLMIVLFVWNAFYGITDFFGYKAHIKYLVWEIVDGRQHLWFIPMIIGLYMISPLLQRWVKNAPEKEVHYIIILFLLFGVIWQTLICVAPGGIIEFADKYRNIPLICGYTGYYLLGYYLVHIGLPKKKEDLLIGLGFAGLILGELVFILTAKHTGTINTGIVDSFSVFTYFYAAGMFAMVVRLFKDRGDDKPSTKILSSIGKDTFGIYLCHIALFERLTVFKDVFSNLNGAAGYLLYGIALFITGAIIAEILRRIPIVGRYIC